MSAINFFPLHLRRKHSQQEVDKETKRVASRRLEASEFNTPKSKGELNAAEGVLATSQGRLTNAKDLYDYCHAVARKVGGHTAREGLGLAVAGGVGAAEMAGVVTLGELGRNDGGVDVGEQGQQHLKSQTAFPDVQLANGVKRVSHLGYT
jgi:hypothetical protein